MIELKCELETVGFDRAHSAVTLRVDDVDDHVAAWHRKEHVDR
jgi:hypothetical protein